MDVGCCPPIRHDLVFYAELDPPVGAQLWVVPGSLYAYALQFYRPFPIIVGPVDLVNIGNWMNRI